MQKIYVFIGVIGSGKDHMAKQIIKKTDAIKTAFADPLREDIWKLMDWRPYTDQEYEDFKVSVFHNDLGIKFTGRDLLLRYGTEIRRKEDLNHWAKQTMQEIERILQFAPAVVITDCRFGNEIEYLKYVAEKLDVELQFTFCNYHSDRYDCTVEHESEKLAQHFVRLGFQHQDKSFDEYIKVNEFAKIPTKHFELY